MSDAVLIAAIGVIGATLGGGGFFTARLASKAQAKQAEAEAKAIAIAGQKQERDEAIDAWKEVAEARAVSLADARAEIAHLRAELDEERQVSSALAKQNEQLHKGRKT